MSTVVFLYPIVSSPIQMSTLEQEGEEVVGQARCPFESRQSNVGLFAGERIDFAQTSKTFWVFIVALKPARLGVTHFMLLLLFTEAEPWDPMENQSRPYLGFDAFINDADIWILLK